jgi:hypothetical protein
MERNVLFYDEQQQEICMHLCKALKIDYLPALDGLNKYELKENNFFCSPIDDSQWIDFESPIFHQSAPTLFQLHGHNVLFVRQHGTLVGVVHFSDYNRPLITEVLQNWVTEFEHTLRRYFTASGKTESDINSILDRPAKIDLRLPPFQSFYLRDLLQYVQQGLAFPLSLTTDELKDINGLRNIAMHGKDVVKNDDWVYDVATLSTLIRGVNTLELKLQQLRTNLFQLDQRSRASLNQKKLEILKESDLAALNFLRSNL